MTLYNCANCHAPFPETYAYKCRICGGFFDLDGAISFHQSPGQPGIWRYRETFGFPADATPVTLGEGNTPLVAAESEFGNFFIKNETANPTGSFKDRLTAVEISFLKLAGIQKAVEDSSGNAGASFAAYAAAAGINGRVYIPDYASGPKRRQIESYGQEVVVVPGPRSAAADAVMAAIEAEDIFYASHAYLPQGLTGLATIAYELVEQLGKLPGTVVAPVGHGSLLYGLILGFEALLNAKMIEQLPVFIGVQAEACAPLWAFQSMGTAGLTWVTEGETLAEGVRVKSPIRGAALINRISQIDLRFHAVKEENILAGRDQLAHFGFYVEPTSAIVWDAYAQLNPELPNPIVLILTGSGLKSQV